MVPWYSSWRHWIKKRHSSSRLCNTLPRTATHCNTLQHTAKHLFETIIQKLLLFFETLSQELSLFFETLLSMDVRVPKSDFESKKREK